MEEIYRAFHIHSDILGHAELQAIKNRATHWESRKNPNADTSKRQGLKFLERCKGLREPQLRRQSPQ